MASFVYSTPILNRNNENDPNTCINTISIIDLCSSPSNEVIKDIATPAAVSSDSKDQEILTPTVANEETIAPNSDERRRNEIEESERLAWQLMQEESMRAYEMQLEYMRNNPEIFSQEDLAAFNSVFQENIETNDEEFEDDEVVDENEDNSENWSYDRLLELARVVGDVKTERWRLRSDAIFNSLPIVTYDKILLDSSQVRSLETNCLICMEEYLNSDELKILPCRHYFHSNCSKGWLTDNNSCPMCKGKVTSSP